MKNMKWWGWGEPDVAFSFANKPAFVPFVQEKLGVDVSLSVPTSMRFEDVYGDEPGKVQVPEPQVSDELRNALVLALGDTYVSDDAEQRVVHTYGKSLRDLLRVRAGTLGRTPDLVLYPGTEAEVVAIVKAALEHDAVLIAFGGGSNITGSLEAQPEERRTVLSVDLQRMNRVIEIDTVAQQARIQAGALGPCLEEQLNDQGWSIGHFPDSFNHSSLGGWIATRSSGMQSDKYGDIAAITQAVRVITPTGILATRAVPSSAAGPSICEMILGSEGRLGIITEATVKVHRLPEKRKILGYIFPTWRDGLNAMHDIAASDASIFVARLSDANETAFSFATQKDSGTKGKLMAKGLQMMLRRKNIDSTKMCLSFIGFEGSAENVARQNRLVNAIVKQHGGLCVGSKPGALYDQKKFDTPYIRDFLIDRGVLADVSETSAPWSRLYDLHKSVVGQVNLAFEKLGVRGWIMCHMSHTEHTGACLYFTFAFPTAKDGGDPIAQYDNVKRAAQNTFIDLGATLSHHHAVGLEHAQWLEPDISKPGVVMLQRLVEGVDPGANFNPGKIVETRIEQRISSKGHDA